MRRFVIRPEDRSKGWPVARNCRDTLREALEQLGDGPPLEVIIREYRPRRSLEQNRLYWSAYVRPLAQHCGVSLSDMHRYLKAELLEPVPVVDPWTGEIVRYGEASTTKLSSQEFSQYLDQVAAMAAEHGIAIPAPFVHAQLYGWPKEET